MFLDFFQLREDPFGVTPDPAYLYLSRTHFEALEALRDGILNGRGFLALIAEPGMGKTTLLYQLQEILPEKSRVAFLFQTQCNSREFFQYLLNELGVDTRGMGLVAMHKKLNEMMFDEMLETNRLVLIVDEAQNLDARVLETIRLLSNFETAHSKLLQIVLAGQPELGAKLHQKELSQLLQRVSVVKQLRPFSLQETATYIRHRLKVAGYVGADIFDSNATLLIHEKSHGIPRIINKLCYNALLEARFQGRRTVTAEIMEKTFSSLDLPRPAAVPTTVKPAMLPSPKQSIARQPVMANSESALPARAFGNSILGMLQSWRARIAAFAVIFLLAGFAMPFSARNVLVQKMRDSLSAARSAFEDVPGARRAPNDGSPGAISGLVDTRTDATASHLESGAQDAGQDPPVQRAGHTYTVVIDPGHGGPDRGLRGPHGLLEKDVCLEIALRLGAMIEEEIPGTQVVYTRNEDNQVSLPQRVQIANGARADLFISIHTDSLGNRDPRSIEMFYVNSATRHGSMDQVKPATSLDRVSLPAHDKIAAQSKRLAANIEKILSQSLHLSDRQGQNFAVKRPPISLIGAHMPAVLAEISFEAESDKGSLLVESSQRERVAQGIYRGVAAYLSGSTDESRQGRTSSTSGGPVLAISSSAAARDPS
jgi:type II secretory pathway predicted ATPase ExeA